MFTYNNILLFFENPAHSEVYTKQHKVIKFISDLRQVSSLLWVIHPPPIKLTAMI